MLATFEPPIASMAELRRGSTMRPGSKSPSTGKHRPRQLTLDDMFAEAIRDSDPLPELDELPQLAPEVRELVLDRIDAAYREGLLAMSAIDYAALLMAIMPDDFIVPPQAASPCDAPPESVERVKTYSQRCRESVAIFHKLDAKADDMATAGDPSRRGVRVKKRGGKNPKVLGWDEGEETV